MNKERIKLVDDPDRIISSIKDFKKSLPRTYEVISFINSLPGKTTIRELADYFQIHKDTIRYHLKTAKEISDYSESDLLNKEVNQALQKVEIQNRRIVNKPRIKSHKKINMISGETNSMFCPDCKGMLILGRCIKCGKVWKQKNRKIIISKAEEYKERKLAGKRNMSSGSEEGSEE